MLDISIHKRFTEKKRQVEIACTASFKPAMTTALYGKSGVGKSTILRMIAGFERPDTGTISYNGTIWFSSEQGINLPISERKLGFVFQDYNLFPTMTVEGNLNYATVGGVIAPDIRQLVDSLELTSLLNSYPNQLSGGQRQRIAIVRALCQKPELLLLDEPFSALDDDAISELITEIQFIQKSLSMMIIVVSHRKDVIFEMAEQVVHLKEGGVVIGTPAETLTRTF